MIFQTLEGHNSGLPDEDAPLILTFQFNSFLLGRYRKELNCWQ